MTTPLTRSTGRPRQTRTSPSARTNKGKAFLWAADNHIDYCCWALVQKNPPGALQRFINLVDCGLEHARISGSPQT
eukprot:6510257-Alexandrium_andersonii.AAC.1